jgi:hypothetical protein
MPVRTKAARPTAASPASHDPRDPQVSDNDLTVLFRRTRAFVARQVAHPRPAPRPPSAGRPADRELREHPTPLAMAVAPRPLVETVVIPPGRRENALTIAAFLVAGCLIGAAVEVVARPAAVLSRGDSATAAAARTIAGASSDEAHAHGKHTESGASDNDNRKPTQGTHHHAHHASNAAASAAPRGSITTSASDAGGDDDFSAAVETLTKAKAEVTLP